MFHGRGVQSAGASVASSAAACGTGDRLVVNALGSVDCRATEMIGTDAPRERKSGTVYRTMGT
jgi:hypothetical protein